MRFLPADAELGRTGDSQPLPLVRIGNRQLRLAPGGIIFDQHNRSIVHAHLPVNADILYTRNQGGDIQRLYILTDQEKIRLQQAGKR